MRRRPSFPFPPRDESADEAVPTAGEILGGLAGVALLGLGAFELHRRGKLADAVSALLGLGPLPELPSFVPPTPPTTPRPKRRAKKRSRAIPKPPPATPPTSAEDEDAAAARLLGVRLDAGEDEIRRAVRELVTVRLRAGQGFGDLANGDREHRETVAINAAKSRLIERARRRGAR